MRISFHVPGPPVPFKRKVSAPGAPHGRATPKKVRFYRRQVAHAARFAMLEARVREPMKGAVRLALVVRCVDFRAVGDIDNYLKLVKDALNGLVYEDDVQVCQLGECERRVDGKNAGIWVTVEQLGREWDAELPPRARR